MNGSRGDALDAEMSKAIAQADRAHKLQRIALDLGDMMDREGIKPYEAVGLCATLTVRAARRLKLSYGRYHRIVQKAWSDAHE